MQKISVSKNHPDFATLLAEALDQIYDAKFDIAVAAARLGVSTSQLIKLLKPAPAAFQLVNRQRQDLGLRRLN